MLNDLLFMIGFFAVWFVLMRFVLPALGVPTCMSGACGLDRPKEGRTGNDE